METTTQLKLSLHLEEKLVPPPPQQLNVFKEYWRRKIHREVGQLCPILTPLYDGYSVRLFFNYNGKDVYLYCTRAREDWAYRAICTLCQKLITLNVMTLDTPKLFSELVKHFGLYFLSDLREWSPQNNFVGDTYEETRDLVFNQALGSSSWKGAFWFLRKILLKNKVRAEQIVSIMWETYLVAEAEKENDDD